jgi:hypothetical protein
MLEVPLRPLLAYDCDMRHVNWCKKIGITIEILTGLGIEKASLTHEISLFRNVS